MLLTVENHNTWRNLSHCHCTHHKFKWTGIKLSPPQWQASEEVPKLCHGRMCFCMKQGDCIMYYSLA